MMKLVLIAVAMVGILVVSGCGQKKFKCTSCNAANDYKCCLTGRFDEDGECDD